MSPKILRIRFLRVGVRAVVFTEDAFVAMYFCLLAITGFARLMKRLAGGKSSCGALQNKKPRALIPVIPGRRVAAYSVLKTGQISFLLARCATARPVSKSVVNDVYRNLRSDARRVGREGIPRCHH